MAESVLPGIPGYDADNLQPWTVAVVASMTVLATVAVALRLLSRHLKAQKLWWDDYMIIFSQLWNFVTVVFIFMMHKYGMGIHADKLQMSDIVLMAKFLLVAEILYVYNLVWSKISILLMYYRIFRFPYFKKMAYGIGAFIIAWVITITFLFVFICVPVAKVWDPELPGHCIDQVGTWVANAASTILSDLGILILPIPQVWKLQLRRPEKIGVTVAFCLGFL
ncbi:putative integral membrane protein [Chaetomidium leptoderma]|uniref:Integral membrane protein n=1 Tax=Chaetomidium leptoderma TaxID=669021 RepID=A0AAN6VD70_9PEZI|nr:putative integral membrane protein [Chaetomidium leptoderma]